MDGGAGFGKDTKMSKFIKIFKGQEILESDDHQRPERTLYTEEV